MNRDAGSGVGKGAGGSVRRKRVVRRRPPTPSGRIACRAAISTPMRFRGRPARFRSSRIRANPAANGRRRGVPGRRRRARSARSFENRGTSQPKFDARVDQELSNGGRLTYEGGVAGTSGIIYTGVGPFDIQSGTYLGFGRVNYSRNALKVNFFINVVERRRAEPAVPGSGDRQAAAADADDADLRLRGGRRAPDRPPPGAVVRRQLPAQQLRHHAGAGSAGPERDRRVRAGRDLPRQVPLQHRRPRGQVRQPRRSRLLAAPGGAVQGRCRISRCDFRSIARSGRRR